MFSGKYALKGCGACLEIRCADEVRCSPHTDTPFACPYAQWVFWGAGRCAWIWTGPGALQNACEQSGRGAVQHMHCATPDLLLPPPPLLLLPPPLHFQACDPNVRPTVQVIDDCDECEANQINLHAAPFAKMAPLGLGRLKIEYREVG